MKGLLALLLSGMLSFGLQAQIHPGKITTLDGQTLEGEISVIAGKRLYDGIAFTDATGNKKEYAPGDIKGFFINEDYTFPANYESIHLDSLGTHFFQIKFTDEDLSYLIYPFPVPENEPPIAIEVYKKGYRIVKMDSDLTALQWVTPKRDSLIKGGVVTEKGDTLLGNYTLSRSKISIDHAGKSPITFSLDKIRGFFNDAASYYNVNVAAPDERERRELCWVMVDGPNIQLMVRQVEINAYERVYNNYNNYYNNYNYNNSYYQRSPTYRKVRSSMDFMYTIRNNKTGKALNFLDSYYKPPTQLGNVMLLRDWLKAYPALQNTALGNVITSEKALVNLYNMHLEKQSSDNN